MRTHIILGEHSPYRRRDPGLFVGLFVGRLVRWGYHFIQHSQFIQKRVMLNTDGEIVVVKDKIFDEFEAFQVGALTDIFWQHSLRRLVS